MEKLEHDLWIVQAANAALGPMARALLRALGRPAGPGNVIPDYLVMAAVIVLFWTVICLIVRRSLSVDNPGKLQVLIEDGVAAARGVLHDYVGHKGPRYLAIVATMFVFILTGNLMGLVPGLKSPTDRKSTRLNSSHVSISYAVFCLKKKIKSPCNQR